MRKVIESALANARVANPDVKVDELWVSVGMVDKGPNQHLRRWRPRAMGRATQIAKGVSHIAITLSDVAPAKATKPVRTGRAKAETASEAATTETGAPEASSTAAQE